MALDANACRIIENKCFRKTKQKISYTDFLVECIEVHNKFSLSTCNNSVLKSHIPLQNYVTQSKREREKSVFKEHLQYLYLRGMLYNHNKCIPYIVVRLSIQELRENSKTDNSVTF